MPDSISDWTLLVGEIVAPFSRFGEVKVVLMTDFPDRFSRLKQVCVQLPKVEPRLYHLTSSRIHKGQALLKLVGIDSINDAETLRGAKVLVKAKDAVPLSDDEFFIHDLIDCEVITVEGELLGKVTQVLSGTANDVYVVGSGKDEILLPAVKEVIRSVIVAEKKIIVSPTPGLLPGEAEEA